jgi:hypothetical protein
VASLGVATIVLLLAIAIGSPVAIYRINHERQRAEEWRAANWTPAKKPTPRT